MKRRIKSVIPDLMLGMTWLGLLAWLFHEMLA